MGRDLAIDIGSANTLVYRQGDGIVFDQPTVVAMHAGTGDVVAMGDEAWQLLGGDSGNVLAVRPLREGTMTEIDVTQRMLAVVLRRVGVTRFPKPRVVVCVPPSASAVERRAIDRALRYAGGRQIVPVEEPLAAAVGADLPVHEPLGNLIVDIGGGRSEMAVVSMGGVVSGRSAPVGGFDLDAAVQNHIRGTYGVAIGEKSAEELKVAIGSAFPSQSSRAAKVIGRELATGSMVEVRVDEDELRQAMAPVVKTIVEEARMTLSEAPPELTHDVLETGMFLTGGGSLLRGLDMLLAQECEVPVHVVERPLETVVRGAGRMLEHLDDYRSTFQLLRRGMP
ncbi:MAG TPA: rod shape-determining protein [Actinomycetota bacterium]|nr:rod shape-determining protein [Actinomycetota bacterium]